MNEPIAAISGVAESDLGVTGKTSLQLMAQASLAALDEAGLTLGDVDGLATAGVSRFPAVQAAEYLGIRPRWTEATMMGGSGFEMYVGRAADAIRAGRADAILVAYGNNQRSAKSRSFSLELDEQLPSSQFEAPYGPLYPISFYAMAARRHMHEFATTSEQLAEVAVAARQWALKNPKAHRHADGGLSVDDVLASPVISSPLHQLDCCLITDGGGAAVITSVERARDLRTKPVMILGHGETSTNYGMADAGELTSSGAYQSSADAYRMAGVDASEIDVAEVYDSFTINVLLTLEALGFCERGESGAFVEGGRISPGGEFPLNTSGGGLSYCHPGMFGLLLVVEAVRQLRGESGDRQIDGAETAICHGTGGILSSHATVILGVDR